MWGVSECRHECEWVLKRVQGSDCSVISIISLASATCKCRFSPQSLGPFHLRFYKVGTGLRDQLTFTNLKFTPSQSDIHTSYQVQWSPSPKRGTRRPKRDFLFREAADFQSRSRVNKASNEHQKSLSKDWGKQHEWHPFPLSIQHPFRVPCTKSRSGGDPHQRC